MNIDTKHDIYKMFLISCYKTCSANKLTTGDERTIWTSEQDEGYYTFTIIGTKNLINAVFYLLGFQKISKTKR